MKTITLFLFLLLSSSLFAESLETDETNTTQNQVKRITFWQVQKVFSWDGLNIRKNADYTSKKIGQIPYNSTCIVNHGCGKDIDFTAMVNMQEEEIKAFLAQSKEEWCYIDHDGITGWAHSYYLTESEASCK